MIRQTKKEVKEGELLLIPINMRDGCIIGRGKGNPDWNYSAPHGAGRIMSRNKAKESITLVYILGQFFYFMLVFLHLL